MGAPGPLPCTPAGIVELLASYKVPVEGKHVVVIGRGLTIGRPLALLLMGALGEGCFYIADAVDTDTAHAEVRVLVTRMLSAFRVPPAGSPAPAADAT